MAKRNLSADAWKKKLESLKKKQKKQLEKRLRDWRPLRKLRLRNGPRRARN
jgi:hypothetical protein